MQNEQQVEETASRTGEYAKGNGCGRSDVCLGVDGVLSPATGRYGQNESKLEQCSGKYVAWQFKHLGDTTSDRRRIWVEDRLMEYKEKACRECGVMYTPKKPNQLYCSRKCKELARKRVEKKWNDKIHPKSLPKKESPVDKIAREAKEAGMSYGKYVSKMMEEERQKKLNEAVCKI